MNDPNAAELADVDDDSDHNLGRTMARLLTVAWMAILLGVVVQTAVLFGKTAAGANFPGLRWIPDLAGGVTWAAFVCAGVAIGITASKARAAVMGLLGLVSAPVAFCLMKGMQKAVAGILETPADKITPLVYMIGGVKTLEYGALGALLGWLLARGQFRIGQFLSAGATVGLVFGGVIVLLTAVQAKAKPPALVGSAINELLFPIGCALVIYLAAYASQHIKVSREVPDLN